MVGAQTDRIYPGATHERGNGNGRGGGDQLGGAVTNWVTAWQASTPAALTPGEHSPSSHHVLAPQLPIPPPPGRALDAATQPRNVARDIACRWGSVGHGPIPAAAADDQTSSTSTPPRQRLADAGREPRRQRAFGHLCRAADHIRESVDGGATFIRRFGAKRLFAGPPTARRNPHAGRHGRSISELVGKQHFARHDWRLGPRMAGRSPCRAPTPCRAQPLLLVPTWGRLPRRCAVGDGRAGGS